VSNNLGVLDKRDEHAARAVALIDRLTSRERYYIEGYHYGLRPETLARSIEAYKQGLALHPEHQASRHNLGLHFLNLERYSEGIEQYEELVRRGISNPTTYENLAGALISVGNARRARQVADDFIRRQPENAVGLRMMGAVMIAEGRLDDARATFQKSEALDPLDFTARLGRRSVAVLQQRWADAEAVNEELAKSPSPFQQFLGHGGEAFVAAARGRSQNVLEAWDRATRDSGLSGQQRAFGRNRHAIALLRQGKPALALAQAERAAVEGRNAFSEYETLQLLAIAQAAVGRKADSEKTLALLESRAKMLPSNREARRVHWARGEIALLQNDASTAVTELMKAQKMLPLHGPTIGPPSSHGDLWFAAALACIKAGRDGDAAQLLERLQTGHERQFAMEAYARSFFLLGQIYERRGDSARAREQYARFLDLWRDGDLEREWVAEAQKKLSHSGSR
jgi:tetratricopeptide (TPR) repeat protein